MNGEKFAFIMWDCKVGRETLKCVFTLETLGRILGKEVGLEGNKPKM